MPSSTNVLGFDNYLEALASYKLHSHAPLEPKIKKTDILFDFYDSPSGSDKGQEDTLIRFDSDNSSKDGGALTRKPGAKYTQYDFEFLEEEWLEHSDEDSPPMSSSSSSCSS